MNVGSQVLYQEKKALVVRRVQSEALFEDNAGNCSLVKETYYELLCEDNTIAFVNETCTTEPFKKESRIRGLDPQIWRPRNADKVQNAGSAAAS